MRKGFFIVWVVAMIIAAAAIMQGSRGRNNLAVSPPAIVEHSMTTAEMANMPGMHMASDSSDQEHYDRIKGEYFDIVNKQSPAEALALVDQRIETDPWLMDHCHPLVHEIGHVAYKKYQNVDEAFKYQDSVCNSGYLHGVIEEYFANTTDVFAAMKTMCNGLDSGRCYHGVGHGLMYYTANNLPKSLDYCSSLSGGDAVSFCAQGVFMENFNTDLKLHPSEYLNPEDPMYPCPAQEEKFKLGCYYYAPTFYLAQHHDDYTAGLAWCNTAEERYQGACTRGISSRATKTHISDLKWVENLCMKGSSLHRNDCIDGMVGFYMNHYDSTVAAKKFCTTLLAENQIACLLGVDSRAQYFID
jgi:hypothetical protein